MGFTESNTSTSPQFAARHENKAGLLLEFWLHWFLYCKEFLYFLFTFRPFLCQYQTTFLLASKMMLFISGVSHHFNVSNKLFQTLGKETVSRAWHFPGNTQ